MRSLLLAGGGLKVGYQAGCLQVFHELDVTFDHVDAASGGCLNAAMIASGKTGTEIANQWRTMPAGAFTTPDWRNYYRTFWMRSVGTSDGLRHIFRDIWKLDFRTIRNRKDTIFTFNHYDFAEKRVVVVENKDLDEDVLIASGALLWWLPAIWSEKRWRFDAVWCTDANVGEAVRRGADEIWAIWTVSDTPELRDGFIAEYFHLIETVANAKFKEEWSEIAAVNAAIANNGDPISGPGQDLRLGAGFDPKAVAKLPPPPGRKTIKQHLIRQEVPVHYLFNFSGDRMAAAVEMGVRDARACARAIGLLPPVLVYPAVQPAAPGEALTYSETMRGFFAPGAADPADGDERGRHDGNALDLYLDVDTAALDAFLHHPEHQAKVNGTVDCPLISGTPMQVTAGSFNLFVNDRDVWGVTVPGRKRMLYTLEFGDAQGTQFQLRGEKYVYEGRGFTLLTDTTTCFVWISSFDKGSSRWLPFGAGILHVLLADFLKELTTFRVPNSRDVRSTARVLGRFARFWAGQAWDVYARKILDYAPF